MADGVGTKLREARTRKRLSLGEIEDATKIRGRYLQAIENEDWDQLPGETYARAFIRTYGSLVGLDGERLAEEQRHERGAARPGEGLPRVDPRPRRVVRRRERRRIDPRLATVGVSALVVAALVVIGLSTGSDEEASTGPQPESDGKLGAATPANDSPRSDAAPQGHSLELVATGEVWVCLLDGRGVPLVDGAILLPGEAEGPFRSDSFTVALGNGAVTMTVDGKEQNLSEPASPIGFTVDSRGAVRELPEGERPTCT
ncbi:MAG TPA: helix-turn-helix transcriptional regulator [Solirubrobacterales bacterium]|nr:helix-turn-helix transcriptional regulator [Solirubrobacterales bacterium]